MYGLGLAGGIFIRHLGTKSHPKSVGHTQPYWVELAFSFEDMLEMVESPVLPLQTHDGLLSVDVWLRATVADT